MMLPSFVTLTQPLGQFEGLGCSSGGVGKKSEQGANLDVVAWKGPQTS
jgi:hypothetical protein